MHVDGHGDRRENERRDERTTIEAKKKDHQDLRKPDRYCSKQFILKVRSLDCDFLAFLF